MVEDDALVRTYVIGAAREPRLPDPGGRQRAPRRSPSRSSGTAFDLLFTDVIMTGAMNGRQLADEMARRRPGIKVLFTSGYTEDAIVHHGRLDPGVLLLAKPYRKAELARMIRQRACGRPSHARHGGAQYRRAILKREVRNFAFTIVRC